MPAVVQQTVNTKYRMRTHPHLINCSYYCINSNIIATTNIEQNNFNELNKRISLRNKKSTQILIFIETAAADEYWSYTHTNKFKWKITCKILILTYIYT